MQVDCAIGVAERIAARNILANQRGDPANHGRGCGIPRAIERGDRHAVDIDVSGERIAGIQDDLSASLPFWQPHLQ